MMKKAGAGLLRSIVGLCLIGLSWMCTASAVQADESPAAEPIAEETAAVPAASFEGANDNADTRIASVKEQTLEELQDMLKEVNLALPAMSQTSSERSANLREARIAAKREAPEIKELYQEIQAIQVKINEVTDTLPAVREKLNAYNEAQSDLFEEMQFRTKLSGLIRQKERAAISVAVVEETP